MVTNSTHVQKELKVYHMLTFITRDEIVTKLKEFQSDPSMNTVGGYSPTAVDWPDNHVPFVEHHLAYLSSHKLVNPEHYLSNLRLMLKIR